MINWIIKYTFTEARILTLQAKMSNSSTTLRFYKWRYYLQQEQLVVIIILCPNKVITVITTVSKLQPVSNRKK